MFKKALLSSLVSAFLALSIFTVATAFGETTPSGTPPSGLASPTFGGLTVIGAPTSEVMRVTGFAVFNQRLKAGILDTAMIQSGTSDDGIALSIVDDVVVTKSLGVIEHLNVKNDIINNTGDVLINDKLNVNDTSFFAKDVLIGDHLNPAALTVTNGLNVYENLDMMGSSSINAVDLNLSGLLKNGSIDDPYPLTIYDSLSVTGKLTASSIGSYSVTYSNSSTVGAGGVATATATCPSGIAISCSFRSSASDASVYRSYPLPGVYSCYTTAKMPTGGSVRAYATCFDPAS